MTDLGSDIEAYRAAFDGPVAATVGIEEEFFLVDAHTAEPRWEAPALCEKLDDPRFEQELPAAQLEHVSAPFVDLADLAEGVRAARRDLLAAAGPDLAFVSSGTHPTAAQVLSVPDETSYHRTLEQHPWAADQQMVAALQVHVAIRPAEVALAVCDALRSYLPELIALSAASPFHAGSDTGLAAVRPLIGTLLPRQGVPPVLGSWARYAELRRWMAAAGVGDEGRLWWEVRPRPLFGTVEVRAMDAQPTADRAIAVATLVTSLAVWLADRARAGEALPVHPTERITENRWRALRGGSAARLADLDTGEVEPLEVRVGRLLEAVAPTAQQLGAGDLLGGVEALLRCNGADAMRQVAVDHGIPAVAPWLAEVFST